MLPSHIQEAEQWFQRLRGSPPACGAAFRSALACIASDGAVLATARRAGLAALDETERIAASMPEHPYHNRYHVAEAVLAMGWLCALSCEEGAITPDEAILGVLAMAGHDFGHDGSRCVDGTLEASAAAAMATFAREAGLEAHACDLVRHLILASMPGGLPVEAARRAVSPRPNSTAQTLVVLSREADVFGSLLPHLGWQLAFALRREWRKAGDPAANEVVSFRSRYRLLAAYANHSTAATRIGLAAVTLKQRRAFELVAQQLGTCCDGAAGAHALDRQSPGHAARNYRSALARCLSA